MELENWDYCMLLVNDEPVTEMEHEKDKEKLMENGETASLIDLPIFLLRWQVVVVHQSLTNTSAMLLSLIHTRKYFNEIPEHVLLCDQYENEFEVCVAKQKDRVYLTDGWVWIDSYIICIWVHSCYFGMKIT